MCEGKNMGIMTTLKKTYPRKGKHTPPRARLVEASHSTIASTATTKDTARKRVLASARAGRSWTRLHLCQAIESGTVVPHDATLR